MRSASEFFDPDFDAESPDVPEPEPGQIAEQNDRAFTELMGMLGNTGMKPIG